MAQTSSEIVPEGAGNRLPLRVNTAGTAGYCGSYPPRSMASSQSSKNISALQIQTKNLGPSKSPLTARFKSKTTSDSPAARSGPPRSLSYHFSVQHSPGPSRTNTYAENIYDFDQGTEFPFAVTSGESNFRGALELGNLEQDRKGKRRERQQEGSWSPRKWFHESPKEEKAGFDFEPGKGTETVDDPDRGESGSRRVTLARGRTSLPQPKKGLPRSFSVPQSPGKTGWGRLRSLLPHAVTQDNLSPTTPSAVTSHTVNITDELITGGLSTLMLRLWFERDERDHRRIPVLLHRLRIRVSDSLHPLHAHKSVFRIECEYANGAARWVVYRQLRDFISLHTHYAFSNAYNRNVGKLPEFPRTSLPYFKFLKKEFREKGKEMGKIEFARIQRDALENYLINLIRAVMFHPSANRLAGFLEISALSISLAQSGGFQNKAGYLRIKISNSKSAGFGRKAATWSERREQRWCAVRESYLVVLEEPGELAIWDVFLLDADFRIERPKRYYRQPLNLIHSEIHKARSDGGHPRMHSQGDQTSTMGTIRQRLSKIFHVGHHDNREQNGGVEFDEFTSSPHQHDPVHSSSSSASSLAPSRAPTPILDPSTNINPLSGGDEQPDEMAGKPMNLHRDDHKHKKPRADVSMHTFYIKNSQMRLKLFAHSRRQMLQWITALEKVAANSPYTGSNRFDSFAPIRLNVAAQWLVDGRDYFWNLSRAILLARETIFIHDWWLTPELQMRRPNKAKYRLDNLLEKKAKEGVKIYIIVYQEVSNRTTPTDSNYTKQRLTSLHPNIMLQRSPSHFPTGTFYWAHHEKMCVIDEAIAFTGGIDICFGRWDTPQHVLVDHPEGPEQEHVEIWPGKDYSNPRVLDFHTLNKPDEDMYDRSKVPRMPWHDVGIQIIGQPARDLARHFVERWNYLLRIKNHTRVLPFLLPPPEFRAGELEQMGLTGTCELQICRSAGPWSLGTTTRVEHSIQNAYLKAIELSEHFVYIENQFFITSTVINDIKVENNVGDALVNRIIRAHRDGTPWKCCIVVPVMPGFAFPIDHSDASALRIIMELQSRTISRGPNSIFARLMKEGIDPDDYISVFALRKWAKLRGVLTTEQIYIHGKTCIVDDRLAIIGSANINERSLRGDRDSEIAAVIRDTDMIDSTMAGMPFKVGRFAHTLRVRLMREHLGVNVDALSEDDLMEAKPLNPESPQTAWDPNTEQEFGRAGVTRAKAKHRSPAGGLVQLATEAIRATSAAPGSAGPSHYDDSQGIGGGEIRPEEQGQNLNNHDGSGFASSVVPTLEEKIIMEHRPPKAQVTDEPTGDKVKGSIGPDSTIHDSIQNGGPPEARTSDGELYGSPANTSSTLPTKDGPPRGELTAGDKDQSASRARSVIRKQLASKLGDKTWTLPTPTPRVDPQGFKDPISDEFWLNVWVACAVHNTEIYRKVFHAIPDDLITTWKQYKDFVIHHERLNMPANDTTPTEPVGRVYDAGVGDHPRTPSPGENARGHKPFEKWERDEMEKLLGELCGHLVLYPNRFLEGEDNANNFLFNADRLLPILIYD